MLVYNENQHQPSHGTGIPRNNTVLSNTNGILTTILGTGTAVPQAKAYDVRNGWAKKCYIPLPHDSRGHSSYKYRQRKRHFFSLEMSQRVSEHEIKIAPTPLAHLGDESYVKRLVHRG